MKKLLLVLVAILFVGVVSSQAQTTTTCTNCKGTGIAAVCGMCGGSGAVYTMFGPAPCPGCLGMGRIPCAVCGGRGYIVWQNNTNYNYNSTYNTNSSSSSNSSSSGYHTYESSYVEVSCHLCGGSGKCSTCNGKGWYDSPFGTGAIACPNCYGGNQSGKCGKCKGSGKTEKFHTEKVYH